MAKKEYNDQYPKSIALTLRICKPYFSSVRVAPRMLWTGADCGLVVRVRGVRARPFPPRALCGDEREDGTQGLPEGGAARRG
eukprot:6192312-Pleurochrysis_carterae.AAC.1